MPVRSTNISPATLRARDRRAAGAIQQVMDLNHKATLGTVSVRFKLPSGQPGIHRAGAELTPAQALLEMMAGNAVEAATVTWKTYTSSGKRGTSTSRKVRVKIRNSEVKQFTTLASFEKWWDGVQQNGPKTDSGQPAPATNPPRPTSSSHGTKR
jgi:hypothetical protein